MRNPFRRKPIVITKVSPPDPRLLDELRFFSEALNARHNATYELEEMPIGTDGYATLVHGATKRQVENWIDWFENSDATLTLYPDHYDNDDENA